MPKITILTFKNHRIRIMEIIKDQDLKRFAENKVNLLRKELNKWYAILEALDSSAVQQTELFESNKKAKPNIRIKDNPTTLRERCEKILYDLDEPMTTRELEKVIEQRYNQKFTFSGFSGSFSQAYRRKSSLIRKYDLRNPAKGIIAVYVLKTWLNQTSGELEQEYLDKVSNKYATK
jgi:hypothetical protein